MFWKEKVYSNYQFLRVRDPIEIKMTVPILGQYPAQGGHALLSINLWQYAAEPQHGWEFVLVGLDGDSRSWSGQFMGSNTKC